MSITMTSAAQQHVSKHLEHRARGLGVRLGVRTTGCSGLSYVLEFVDDAAAGDEIIECGDVKLVIDPKSLLYLDGTELDYVKEGLNEGFEFRNPNVKDECGCGESFHV
jgi:iron-sulfur cluster assembly protein